MVDFNNDSTISTPPGDVVKIVVLERREQVIEALESYYYTEHSQQEGTMKEGILYSRLMAFWFQLQAMVYRRCLKAKGTPEDPTYEMVEKMIVGGKTLAEMKTSFEWMNVFVDEMGLTFIDSRPRYDRRNIEDANTKKGL